MTLLKRLRGGWDQVEALTTYSTARTDRHRILVEAFGVTKALTEWEVDSRMRVTPEEFISRLSAGWPAEKALAEGSREPKSKIRSPQKLYHGMPLTHWLKDPRCMVSRATLVRNFEIGLPLPDALQYRIQNRSEEESMVADTVTKALDLMAGGGEIWHYKEYSQSRISLIVGNERYQLSDAILADLTSMGHVNPTFSSPSLTMYELTGRSR